MKPTDTFESMLTDLEKIVRELEDGNISLDDALTRYEKGVGLLRLCYDKLKTAEQKIQQLTGVDAEGRPILTQESEMDGTNPKSGRRRKAKEAEDDE